jgi:SAM-dependent methyltransferase
MAEEGGQFHFHPGSYMELMTSELPDYFRLQDEAAAATGAGARRLLELGTGTGETALRVLARHPGAALVGIDVSADMLAVAGERLPSADLRVARLEDPLPSGRSTSSSRSWRSTTSTVRRRPTSSAASPRSSGRGVGSSSATSSSRTTPPTRSRR